MKSVLLILLPFYCYAQAQDDGLITKKSQVESLVIKKYPEIYLNDQVLLEQRDDTTGIIKEDFYTAKDDNRLTLQFLISSNLLKANDLKSFELVYGRQFNNFWLDAYFAQTQTVFESVAENRTTTSGNVSSEANNPRGDRTKQTILSFGLGPTYRFRMHNHITIFDQVFQTVGAYATYNVNKDDGHTETYRGPGLKTDFGIHYRSSKGIALGWKLSYNLMTASRAQSYDNEPRNERSFVYSWLSTGIDLTLYY